MGTELELLLGQVERNEEARQALSKIRGLIKEGRFYREFLDLIQGREEILIGMLENEDGKTRKNAALLMGDVAGDLDEALDGSDMNEVYTKALFDAYEKEDCLFVKSSYLVALSGYDYSGYLELLKSKRENLLKIEVEDNNRKHINEELKCLDELIIACEGIRKHSFTGNNICSDVILLGNRKNINVVEEQLLEIPGINKEDIKTFHAGIMVSTDCIGKIIKLRTYKELLFKVKGMTVLPMDALEAAKIISQSEILQFLRERHRSLQNDAPFYFRVEVKSNMDLGEKSVFAKKFAGELEKLTSRNLINNKSHYEFEIRLIETKEKNFNCMLKLFTIEDDRFAYRKESVAASIRPDNAALIIELAKEYMIEDARVLDPFCGVGTLLIERQMVVKANTSYEIDIYGEAIEKARINTDAAGQIIHYINRDFFDFEHEYLFDEILTDMPFATGHKSKDEIEDIYRKFFIYARDFLMDNGRIIMYTHDRDLVTSLAKKHGFKILAHHIILEKASTDLFVLQME